MPPSTLGLGNTLIKQPGLLLDKYPTEAWDFTAETNPHNLHPHSEDASSWENNSGVLVTPNVDGVADKVEDSTTSDNPYIEQTLSGQGVGTDITFEVKVKKDSNQTRFPLINMFEVRGGPISQAHLNTETGEYVKGTTTNKSNHVEVIDKGNYWLVSLSFETSNDNTIFTRVFPAYADALDGNRDQSVTGSVVIKEAQIVRGEEKNVPYVSTTGSIAFPQTVPALRDSANDLTLGSDPGADTADPDWVAPAGLRGDGNDDTLPHPNIVKTTESFTIVTRFNRSSYTGSELRLPQGKIRPGDSGQTLFLVRDVDGNVADLVDSRNPGLAVFSLTFDKKKEELRGGIDLQNSGQVDTSTLGDLTTSLYDSFLHPARPDLVTHIIFYSRALTDEEALYARQRILDNPNDPFPNHTTP